MEKRNITLKTTDPRKIEVLNQISKIWFSPSTTKNIWRALEDYPKLRDENTQLSQEKDILERDLALARQTIDDWRDAHRALMKLAETADQTRLD